MVQKQTLKYPAGPINNERPCWGAFNLSFPSHIIGIKIYKNDIPFPF